MSGSVRYYIIAIGGAAMHNIALDLVAQGHNVEGSDDEIYEPSRSRLEKAGILPSSMGWDPARVTDKIDVVILGMHARADNPELMAAQSLGLKILSYPAFIYQHSVAKTRLVVAGSHGKTTTTAMILHVLQKLGRKFDYLVGAQLEGFDRMVSLTEEATLIVIEGDEYLSSPIDRVPKIHHYKPHIAVLTGIAWDHINVFPTFANYKDQFQIFLQLFEPKGTLIYCQTDPEVIDVVEGDYSDLKKIGYDFLQKGEGSTVVFEGNTSPISIIGRHNLQNMNAAYLACHELGISSPQFFEAISDFRGAAKRLQLITDNNLRQVFLDFAHAPSKVLATTSAVKDWFGDRPLLAVLELHTFSSLNVDFMHQYKDSLAAADVACVYFDQHTLQMKSMDPLDPTFVKEQFDHQNIEVFTEQAALISYLCSPNLERHNVLLMTSGTFGGMDYKSI
jgi:UDP-N-acetylmuramate: L-alanyl-gamma-D-glutamyl-meso-diaminopimelate ligase